MSEVKKEEFDALKATVDTLVKNTSAEALGKVVADAIKPVTDELAANKANAAAAEKAEKDALVEKVVKANILTKEVAEELTLNALKAMAAKIKVEPAAGLFPAFNAAGADDQWKDYSFGEVKEAANA